MDRQGIHDFLKEIDARQVRDEGDWVMCACPLAPWMRQHGNRDDKNPSFGVSVHDEDKSIFNCFTCHNKGTLVTLLERLQRYQGEDYSEMIEEFGVAEEMGAPLGRYKESGAMDREKFPEPLDKLIYDDLYEPLDPYHWYLRERDIGPQTCERLQLKWDGNDHGVKRILFPIYDIDGGLHGFSGRSVDNGVPKIRDYHGLKKKFMLLGIHLVKDAEYVLLTEGLFDYARGIEFGLPIVAAMHSGLTDEQAEILVNLGKPVYGFQDNDAAGREGNQIAASKLIAHVPFMSIRWPNVEAYRVGSENEPCVPGDFDQLFEHEAHRMIDKANVYRINKV